MEKRDEIREELRELGSRLAELPLTTPYSVPAGYFDQLPASLLRLSTEEDPALVLSSKAVPFSLPSDYFNKLPDTILQKVREQDLNESEQLPAILSDLRNENVYRVPDGYFESLPAIILSRVREDMQADSQTSDQSKIQANASLQESKKQPGATVVRGNFGRKIWQYAAAAVLTGIVLTAGFFLVNDGEKTQAVANTTLLEQKTSQTSDEDILNYLETQTQVIPDLQLLAGTSEIQDDAILDMLDDVSDEELQQYLQLQTGKTVQMN